MARRVAGSSARRPALASESAHYRGRPGVIGLALLSVTDEAGGFTAYHPYDFLGLEIVVVALGISIVAGWQLITRARRTPDTHTH